MQSKLLSPEIKFKEARIAVVKKATSCMFEVGKEKNTLVDTLQPHTVQTVLPHNLFWESDLLLKFT